MPLIRMKDGTNIWYEEYGQGDRYVICTQVGHGLFSLEKELAKRGFHVYLLTNRGFGKSTHVTADYGDHWYDRFADDVIEFADQMGIERFVYSGASHGAGTGWHVVMNHPERVTCFFATVPGPHNLDEGKRSFRSMQMDGEIRPPVFQAPTDDEEIIKRRKLEKAADDAARQAPDYRQIYESPETLSIDYGRPLRALQTEEKVQEALRKIKVPVLILGGTEDTISRPDLMLRTAMCLPKCKLIIYSGIGHSFDIWEEAAMEAERFYLNVIQSGRCYERVVSN